MSIEMGIFFIFLMAGGLAVIAGQVHAKRQKKYMQWLDRQEWFVKHKALKDCQEKGGSPLVACVVSFYHQLPLEVPKPHTMVLSTHTPTTGAQKFMLLMMWKIGECYLEIHISENEVIAILRRRIEIIEHQRMTIDKAVDFVTLFFTIPEAKVKQYDLTPVQL